MATTAPSAHRGRQLVADRRATPMDEDTQRRFENLIVDLFAAAVRERIEKEESHHDPPRA